MERCNCCNGETVFSCQGCGNALATERKTFVDTSGIEFDPNYEHAIYVCVDCLKLLN